MKNKKLIVFTGAGVSVDSGLNSFRNDENGFWKDNDPDFVANINSWNKAKNRSRILEFHKMLYQKVLETRPNKIHFDIKKLENFFEKVVVVSQNVDDLHEKAGSKKVIHLHGEITKLCNKSKTFVSDVSEIYKGNEYINFGDKHSDETQFRPFVVWFGEDVPELYNAVNEASNADILLVIGTSLNVYPAANILNYFQGEHQKIYVIDPDEVIGIKRFKNLTHIKEYGSTGIDKFIEKIK